MEEIAALLVLLSIGLICGVWVWIWRALVRHRMARGGRRWAVHGLGCLVGYLGSILAGMGLLCLLAAFFVLEIPGEDRLLMGLLGTLLLLLLYAAVHGFDKRALEGKTLKDLWQESKQQMQAECRKIQEPCQAERAHQTALQENQPQVQDGQQQVAETPSSLIQAERNRERYTPETTVHVSSWDDKDGEFLYKHSKRKHKRAEYSERSAMDWIVPLAIGLWIGNAWGDDD